MTFFNYTEYPNNNSYINSHDILKFVFVFVCVCVSVCVRISNVFFVSIFVPVHIVVLLILFTILNYMVFLVSAIQYIHKILPF